MRVAAIGLDALLYTDRAPCEMEQGTKVGILHKVASLVLVVRDRLTCIVLYYPEHRLHIVIGNFYVTEEWNSLFH